MTEMKIISAPDGESFRIELNGKEVGYANYDNDGWHGMSAIKKVVRSIAEELGIVVVQEHE